jgi:hypothetical protein
MPVFTYSDPNWNGLKLVTERPPDDDQNSRILAALGSDGSRQPRLDDDTLYQYYSFLAENLQFPFHVSYPQSAPPFAKVEYHATVLEVLDPRKYASDDLSGIFCKTKKGKFEVNLPLVELDVPQDNPNYQLIDDYCHWFWYWRW